MQTPICDFGEKASDSALKNVDGSILTLEQCRGEKGTVIMFISNHCPYVKAIQTTLVEDANKLLEFGVNCIAIMPNDTMNYPDDSFENMQRVAKEWHYPFPYLIDETQEIARLYDAICTPDFFGYNQNLELQYRGRLNSITPSNKTPEIIGQDLVDAMKLVAETGKGPKQQTSSMGCSIKWKQ